MSNSLEELINEHHGYYEVSPHYIVVEGRSPGATNTTRRVHSGFDIDIYTTPPAGQSILSPASYGLAYEGVRQLAERVPRNGDCLAIEVIHFASTIVLDARDHFRPQSKLRIRVCHYRGLDHAAGPPEQATLAAIEQQLRELGAVRR